MNKWLPEIKSEKGAIPFLILFGVLALVAFFTISSSVSVKSHFLGLMSNMSSSYASGGVAISSCQDITTSGTYTLSANISNLTGKTCMKIHDTSNVILDCNNNVVTYQTPTVAANSDPLIQISNLNTFTIRNCSFKQTTNPLNYTVTFLQLANSNNGTISQNSFLEAGITLGLDMNNIQGLTFSGNNVNALFQARGSKNLSVTGNNFTNNQRQYIAALIVSTSGSQNNFSNNTLDGGWDTITPPFENQANGADDGFAIVDETGDTFDHNVMNNNWDCAFENSGTLTNSKITNNTSKNNGLCGIGGWYFSSWLGNTVANNTFDTTPYLFNLYRWYGILSSEQYIYFKDNSFTNNVLKTPHFYTQRTIKNSTFDMDLADIVQPNLGAGHVPTVAQMVLSNNTLTGNDFGYSVPAPLLKPLGMFKDGGGNKCIPSTDPNYPIICDIGYQLSGKYFITVVSRGNPVTVTGLTMKSTGATQYQYVGNPVTQNGITWQPQSGNMNGSTDVPISINVAANVPNGNYSGYGVLKNPDNGQQMSVPVTVQVIDPIQTNSNISCQSNVSQLNSSGLVNLSWSAFPGTSSYYVFRDNVPITAGSSTSYADTNVYGSVGKQYLYQIKAMNQYGQSVGVSNLIPINTINCYVGTQLSLSSNSGCSGPGKPVINVGWAINPPSTQISGGYLVKNGNYMNIPVISNNYSDSAVSPGALYNYFVYFYTSGGWVTSNSLNIQAQGC